MKNYIIPIFILLLLGCALSSCQVADQPAILPEMTQLPAPTDSELFTPIVAKDEATPVIADPTATLPILPAETPTPEASASPLPPSQAGWSYFSNPGGGGAFHTVGRGPTGWVIVTSDLSGAYLNQNVADPNEDWQIIGLNRGLTATHVSATGFHPTNEQLLFLGTDYGIFRSEDGAQSFEQVFDHGYIHDIAVIESDGQPAVVYATYHPEWNSTEGQILKSDDDGRSWSIVSQNLPSGLRLIKLLATPNNPSELFALSGEGRFGTGPAALFHSTDGATTWTQVGSTLGNIMDVARDSEGRLWLTTYETAPQLWGELYLSSDNGVSWSYVAQRHGVIWPAADGRLRLIEPRYQFPWDERNGVWQSADDGQEWEQISRVNDYDFGWSTAFFAHLESFDGPVRTLALDGDVALWVNSQFVFGSFDRGESFQNLYTRQAADGSYSSRRIDNIVFFDTAISAEPTDGGRQVLYMAMYDMGCFRSITGGERWENCNVPSRTGNWDGAGGNSFTVITDPTRAETVWMTQAGDIGEPVSLLRSDDYGAADSWQASGSGLPQSASITGLSIDPNSPADNRTLFVAVAGDVYRSNDDGWSWELVYLCGGCRFTAIDPHGSGTVMAGGEAGLFRSPLAGDSGSWSAVHVAEMIGDVQGDFWEFGWSGVRDIAHNPTMADHLVVAVLGAGRGVYGSQDGGLTWQKLLTDRYVRDVHFTENSLLVASSSAWESGGYDPAGQGVLRSRDNGQTWQTANDGLPWPFPAKFVTLSEEDETILLAVQGPGLYVTDFGVGD